MSDWETCKKCGQFDPVDRHRCPPIYLVWSKEWYSEDEEGRRVYAYSHGVAAEIWAAWSDDDGDYTIVSGSPATVRVTREDTGEVKWFEVTGESVPSYNAHETEPPP